MKKPFTAYLFLLFSLSLFQNKVRAQEFKCQVAVNSQQIQTTEKRVFENMQSAIYDFINNRKWTNYTYKPEEKIECNISLVILEQSSRNSFKAQLNIQSRRPVYNSNYTTSLINFMEPDFVFTYDETAPFEYSPTTFFSNLSSTISYYLYILLGLDADSFSLEGGTSYFTIAQTILQTADKTDYKGWKSYDGSKSRYWIMENYTNPVYRSLRDANYKYHRLGLDMMTINQTKARANIIEALRLIQLANKEKQGLLALQLFVDVKVDEIINIFTPASDTEKNDVMEILKIITPVNFNKIKTAFTTK